jgi:hypothetical protein
MTDGWPTTYHIKHIHTQLAMSISVSSLNPKSYVHALPINFLILISFRTNDPK